MQRNRRTLVDARDLAEHMRRTFHDTEPRRSQAMGFTWPKELQVVGKCLSVSYSSDKWKRTRDWEDYKHVAEGPQYLLAPPDFLRDWESDETIETVGPMAVLPDPMPRHFAMLAKFISIQCQLYSSMSGRRPKLGRGARHLLEFKLGRAHLGGAYVPDDAVCPDGIGLSPGAPFLFVYRAGDGVGCVVTGTQLDVERDGIVG